MKNIIKHNLCIKINPFCELDMTPQHQKILELHDDGGWHCSTEIEYIRDQRKRVSELRQMGYVFEKLSCDSRCGHSHNSGLLMRRLVKTPEPNLESRKEWRDTILSAHKREQRLFTSSPSNLPPPKIKR